MQCPVFRMREEQIPRSTW